MVSLSFPHTPVLHFSGRALLLGVDPLEYKSEFPVDHHDIDLARPIVIQKITDAGEQRAYRDAFTQNDGVIKKSREDTLITFFKDPGTSLEKVVIYLSAHSDKLTELVKASGESVEAFVKRAADKAFEKYPAKK